MLAKEKVPPAPTIWLPFSAPATKTIALTPTGAVPDTVTVTGKAVVSAGLMLNVHGPGDGGAVASVCALAADASDITAMTPTAAIPNTLFMLPTTPPGGRFRVYVSTGRWRHLS